MIIKAIYFKEFFMLANYVRKSNIVFLIVLLNFYSKLKSVISFNAIFSFLIVEIQNQHLQPCIQFYIKNS
ncbi:hypothetical protein BOW57_12275 [Flavobacterium sp. YO64]|nr:hypothetical protein BOW57_12275 [Flavobacterium sp. YO64]